MSVEYKPPFPDCPTFVAGAVSRSTRSGRPARGPQPGPLDGEGTEAGAGGGLQWPGAGPVVCRPANDRPAGSSHATPPRHTQTHIPSVGGWLPSEACLARGPRRRRAAAGTAAPAPAPARRRTRAVCRRARLASFLCLAASQIKGSGRTEGRRV